MTLPADPTLDEIREGIAILGVLATAQTIVIISGGLDISGNVGSPGAPRNRSMTS